MEKVILREINKYFGEKKNRIHVLTNVNFKAQKGELCLVLGPSGSGKSTFLTIAGGIQTPSSGEVLIDNVKLDSLKEKQKEQLRLEKIGFVLQNYSLVPYLRVEEQFELARRVKKEGNMNKADFTAVIKQLGIADLLNQYPRELSGGQRQRVAIARALYSNPDIIFADEPTAALDSQRVVEVGKLFRDLAHNHNKSVIIVTHDLRLKEYANRIYEIMDGNLKQV
ncbi:ABC transporter ATP-binding protein [Liquorilactobacillus mali]|uniref:Putative hemin import ATP-binding protein HrtA n=1 Tax=Liquorilactobacillus mali KCTC 3596 = DSM 20444 TaxID=1046596 RepID=J0L6L7_9LACO|nr:ABC transporter ATP-binding protein [Liquorilactobacillus mali]EJF00572.1 ABC transporter-like protein [Liquorilactobacillus mali KCTC 3596 = DSM 20444]KRN10185.1 ABC transporter-like protein [Liquorilactobacillus mali KCTC 3596 = DSM 20444]MDV7757866.1 ATP-binding cassette domain-containing protein [Liquorilactobacillus mali]QFQ74057.1 ABC transporter ATP-binding protein [Liquorilactobacillus mali]